MGWPHRWVLNPATPTHHCRMGCSRDQGTPFPATDHLLPLQVEVFRAQDAQKGVKVAQVLEGFIGRKVVKQTVMTVVYGVTLYGGRLQIEKRLRELPTFPQV